MNKIITCPRCAQKLRVPADKNGWATCPKCKYVIKVEVEQPKKKTFIDEVHEERKRTQPEAYTYKEPVWKDPTDELINTVLVAVKDYVRSRISLSGTTPIIGHYYYSKIYHGEDIPDDNTLEYDNFEVISSPAIEMGRLVTELEKRIKNEVGYTYCEVRLINKMLREDVQVEKIFSSDKKWEYRDTYGNAIWIRAAMNEVDFNSVHPGPSKVRYDRRRGRGE